MATALPENERPSRNDADTSTTKDEPDITSEAPTTRPPHEILLIVLLCSTQLINQASVGMVILPLHIIGRTFDSPTSALAWHLAAYSLTVGTFVLPSGRLGDIYGHKKLIVTGWIWFGLWSVIAGLSSYTHSGIFFDVCRAMQGIGPAMLLPNALAVAGRVYKPGSTRKRWVFAMIGAMAPTGALLGGIVGSGFAQLGHWPIAFYLHAGSCIALAVLAIFIVPGVAEEEKTENGQKRFDWLGSALGVSGLVLINFAWNQAAIVGWRTPYIYALLIAGVVVMALFGLSQRMVSDPLLPPGVFNVGAVSILICVALGWSSFGIWFYYSFNIIEITRHFSPLAATAQFAPEVMSGVCACVATAYMLGKVSPDWLMTMASFAFFTGCLFVATSPEQQVYWANMFISMLIMAWGMDISFPASATLLSDMVPKAHQGISASLVNTIINYSISIGLGVSGTVEMKVRETSPSLFTGYRAAMWTSVGLSGLALIVSAAFAVRKALIKGREKEAGTAQA
ncbi:MAG: hypothetical protein M1828_003600 [Chrysothrix sp. TS-e1954]|nr:MAG: hypothetical protein M1828_003600 [Chrysothrix sp. TS-e1954]